MEDWALAVVWNAVVVEVCRSSGGSEGRTRARVQVATDVAMAISGQRKC